jgi:hypothetical protein
MATHAMLTMLPLKDGGQGSSDSSVLAAMTTHATLILKRGRELWRKTGPALSFRCLD